MVDGAEVAVGLAAPVALVDSVRPAAAHPAVVVPAVGSYR